MNQAGLEDERSHSSRSVSDSGTSIALGSRSAHTALQTGY